LYNHAINEKSPGWAKTLEKKNKIKKTGMSETAARPAARRKFTCGGHRLDSIEDGEKLLFVSLPVTPGRWKKDLLEGLTWRKYF
jgi:hypothetical protein